MALMRYAVEFRKRLPAPLRRWADSMLAAQHGPALWAKNLAARGIAIPEPLTPRSDAEQSVLFGPLNYAGQGYRWALSLRQSESRVDARALAVEFPGGFQFEADLVVPIAVYLGSTQWRREVQEANERFSHIVIESFASLLGLGTGSVVEREIERYRTRGQRVALLCHGSDIRDPGAHARRERYSPYAVNSQDWKALQRAVDVNRRVLDSFDGPVFISTLDLLDDVPYGVWLPVVVDVDLWSSAAHASSGDEGPLRVLHIPSSGPIKGTSFVDAAASELETRGLITYERLTGVPAAEMPGRIAAADIVIDQLLLGSYGVAACEAMAAERVVVGNVSRQVRAQIRERTGWELPIVQADPDDLTTVIARLAADPAARADAARAGAAFVRAVHDGSRTPHAMSAFLGYAAGGSDVD